MRRLITSQSGASTILVSRLAGLLSIGTLAASSLIAFGMLLRWTGLAADVGSFAIIQSGVALLILLPVARVVVMLIYFLHNRDYRFGIVAGLVLSFVAAAFAFGATMA